ncbi:hypothetical protein [Massilia sp. BKSP1R2A-1]|uniref:hypothetical protein n=1 Tax=Massilia sp. BKSP1R2A-1 TaxID=3422595 RepID=UPI003D342D31
MLLQLAFGVDPECGDPLEHSIEQKIGYRHFIGNLLGKQQRGVVQLVVPFVHFALVGVIGSKGQCGGDRQQQCNSGCAKQQAGTMSFLHGWPCDFFCRT